MPNTAADSSTSPGRMGPWSMSALPRRSANGTVSESTQPWPGSKGGWYVWMWSLVIQSLVKYQMSSVKSSGQQTSLSKFPSDSLLMTLLTKWKYQYSDFIRNRSGRCYCVYGWCVCMVHIRSVYAQCVCGVCLHVEGDRGWCLISSSVALHLDI